jgi:hypothetical protein
LNRASRGDSKRFPVYGARVWGMEVVQGALFSDGFEGTQ